jgi:hypothetical protein
MGQYKSTKDKKELNKEILPYYFQFGYIPAPHTIFKNTYKLEPGHYLEFSMQHATFNVKQYWSVDTCYEQEKFDKSEQEILDDQNIVESSKEAVILHAAYSELLNMNDIENASDLKRCERYVAITRAREQLLVTLSGVK